MSNNDLREAFKALLSYPKQPSDEGLNRDTAATNFRSYAGTLAQDATPLPDFERGVMVGSLGIDVPVGTTFGQAAGALNRHFDAWWKWHEQARGGR